MIFNLFLAYWNHSEVLRRFLQEEVGDTNSRAIQGQGGSKKSGFEILQQCLQQLYHRSHIWVNFPRTGKMVKMWHFFYFFWSSAVTKRFDFSTILNCSEEILPVTF